MKYIKSDSRGATAGGLEHNDCTVRALANASAMPYEDAHVLLKKYGRKNRCGAKFSTMHSAYKEAGFVLDSVHGTNIQSRYVARITKREAEAGITLGKILPKLSFGEYIVNVNGHALAVVNGKVIDTFDNSSSKRVVAVFKKIEKFGE
jgi:hypothetical protein